MEQGLGGWIKLYRKIHNSSMYQQLTAIQRDVLIQCLLLANHESNEWEWKGNIYTCKPGQFITSLQSLKDVCAKDVSIQNIRTALLKLEKWQFLTNDSTKTGRLITIINWNTYQPRQYDTNNEINKQLTKHQQSTNKALTTNKNNKNDKNEKNDKNIFIQKKATIKTSVPEKFPVTNEMIEYARLKGLNNSIEKLESITEDFLNWHGARGNKFVDWNRAWQNWIKKHIEISKIRKKSNERYEKNFKRDHYSDGQPYPVDFNG